MTQQKATSALKISHTIGRFENGKGTGFRNPVSLAINDRLGRIYVVNRSTEHRPDGKRVNICNVDEDYLGEFGRGGIGDGEFTWPSGIAIDKDDNVYVADEWLNRISIFSKDGQFLGKWGAEGSGNSELDRPAALAFDREDNLLVVDGSNNRVKKFTKDGKYLNGWGQAGSGDGEFNLPWGIEVDSKGDVYIADWRNDRIQKFNSDGSFMMKFGNSGNGDGQFNRPTGVAVDQDGDVYVTDLGNNRIQTFDSRGNFVVTYHGEADLSKWAKVKLESNPTQLQEREASFQLETEKLFLSPIAVEIDAEGRIFVAECSRYRIQVYTKG